ncbi:MAG: hypothetical protein KDB14_28350 [Planctomycetales bacterium]|nr:hypothetical protein [Planctomycetales bacterium]
MIELQSPDFVVLPLYAMSATCFALYFTWQMRQVAKRFPGVFERSPNVHWRLMFGAPPDSLWRVIRLPFTLLFSPMGGGILYSLAAPIVPIVLVASHIQPPLDTPMIVRELQLLVVTISVCTAPRLQRAALGMHLKSLRVRARLDDLLKKIDELSQGGTQARHRPH